MENQAGAAATIKTGKTSIKSFLEFCKAPLDSVITRDQLTDTKCANYISAVWNSEPPVGPATIRGNQSFIFHTAFINLGMKPLKEQPENYIATINTMKGIKHTLRWKCHAPKKADTFIIHG